jgi:hypothetical protein
VGTEGESEGLFFLQRLIDFELEIAEVIGSDEKGKDFINDRQQVMERADGLEPGCIWRTEDAACGGQDQGVFDSRERNAAIIKRSRQNAVIAAEDSGGSGHAAIGFQDFADVIALREFGLHGRISALRFTQRRPVDLNGVAEVAETAQERIDHGAVAEEVVPFVIT